MTPEISHARYRAGHGEPLILLHGFTATWRSWLPSLAELVPRFEVIAPTLHGHDGGPKLAPGEIGDSYADAADHAEKVLDELGIESAHFAGNSMGGALSLELAKRGRARSVVAIAPSGSPGAFGDPAERERIRRFFTRSQRMARLASPRLPLLMRGATNRRIGLRDVMARGDQVPAAEAIALIRSSIRCSIVDEVLAALRTGDPCLNGLDQIDCPVLVVWGDRDRVLRMERHAPSFRAQIPGVEFRVLPGLGHMPMWDDPRLLASTIGDFAAAHATERVVAVTA